MKDIEAGSARQKMAVAEVILDRLILKEAASGNF